MKKTTTKTSKKTTTKTSKKTTDVYNATLNLFGRNYTSTGSSSKECIEKLEYKGKFPLRGILSIQKGEKKVEKLIAQRLGARLFAMSPLMREIAIKSVSLMFDGL